MKIFENKKCYPIAIILIIFISIIVGRKMNRNNMKIPEQISQLCQTDYTRMVYEDGYYYYQSSANYLYLYRMDENGENSTCLVKQVPEEIYIVDEWVYFTNCSEGKTLWRVKKEGGEAELVLEQKIDRFFPIEESFYCLTEEGNFYVWDRQQDFRLLYPEHGWWMSTDGMLLYLWIQEGESVSMVVLDLEGKRVSEYEGTFSRWTIADNQNIYYLVDKDGSTVIMKQSVKNGETIELTENPYVKRNTISGYMKEGDNFYILCTSVKSGNAMIDIYQYECLADKWSQTYEKQVTDKELEYYGMIWEMTNVNLVNGNIFWKRPSVNGKGELWYRVACENGEETLFEDMEPLSVRILSHDDMFYGVNQESGPFQSEDLVYFDVKEDDEGNRINTEIKIPQFCKQIPAYETINKLICKDAEYFYKEQMEFAEDIRETAKEWLGESVGTWKYWYAFADKDYVCVAYWKFLGQNGLDDIKSNEFVVKLYDSETGEEVDIMDLFTVGKEELMLRLGFAIRKTFLGLDMLNSDLSMVGGCYYHTFYILTDRGVDVLLVEKVPTKVYHFEISYEELEDIFIQKEADINIPEIEIHSSWVEVTICNDEEYKAFINMLNNIKGCSTLKLNMSGVATTVFLDEIMMCGNFTSLEISNGGIIAVKNTDKFSQIPYEEDGVLKGIYRLNEGDYSYTSYEFYKPESEEEICAVYIAVDYREGDDEKRIAVLQVPQNRYSDIKRRGVCGTQIMAADVNFDGYKDVCFSGNDDYLDGYDLCCVFLWNQQEKRYTMCDTAPRYIRSIDTERKRLTDTVTLGASGDDYYIYEYRNGAYHVKKLENRFSVEEQEDGNTIHKILWYYSEDGKLKETLEYIFNKDENITHIIYQGKGGMEEEMFEGEQYYPEVGKKYFPEFDFYWLG